jgi:hypothetical protein
MKPAKRKRLAAAGWRAGSAAELLALTPEESAFVEMKLALARELRARRAARGLTQTEAARRLRSSQSRVAKMEAGEPSVSVDLLIRSLLALGARPADVARAIERTGSGLAG